MLDGEIPRPAGISDEFIEYFKKISAYNAVTLAKIAAEKS